jgi:hypothetical protein
MTIDELIEILKAIKKEHGNLTTHVFTKETEIFLPASFVGSFEMEKIKIVAIMSTEDLIYINERKGPFKQVVCGDDSKGH